MRREAASRGNQSHEPIVTYYHGGAPGLCAGATLLPASETGFNPRGDHLRDASFVFVTPEREYACFYASHYPNRIGTIYEVDPVGLQPAGILPWERRATAARVVRVIGQPFFAPRDAWFDINNPAMKNYCEDTMYFIRLINGKIGVMLDQLGRAPTVDEMVLLLQEAAGPASVK